MGLFATVGGESEWTVNTWRFIAGLIATMGLLGVGHLFRWPRKLKEVEAYTYGVASILLGYAIWLGIGLIWWQLCAFAAAGGIVVGLLYWYERDRNLTIRVEQPDAPAHDDH